MQPQQQRDLDHLLQGAGVSLPALLAFHPMREEAKLRSPLAGAAIGRQRPIYIVLTVGDQSKFQHAEDKSRGAMEMAAGLFLSMLPSSVERAGALAQKAYQAVCELQALLIARSLGVARQRKDDLRADQHVSSFACRRQAVYPAFSGRYEAGNQQVSPSQTARRERAMDKPLGALAGIRVVHGEHAGRPGHQRPALRPFHFRNRARYVSRDRAGSAIRPSSRWQAARMRQKRRRFRPGLPGHNARERQRIEQLPQTSA